MAEQLKIRVYREGWDVYLLNTIDEDSFSLVPESGKRVITFISNLLFNLLTH